MYDSLNNILYLWIHATISNFTLGIPSFDIACLFIANIVPAGLLHPENISTVSTRIDTFYVAIWILVLAIASWIKIENIKGT